MSGAANRIVHTSAPTRRQLQIYAYDPVRGRVAGNRVIVDVANEPLLPGPVGSKVEIVDYDSTRGVFLPPIDLEDPNILMMSGLNPAEGDHYFHQQMVYAVAMKTIESFERALGREIRFRHNKPLRIFPHAFRGPNGFYDHETRALLFGYFRADQERPGLNIPKQWVFTCLSQDIVAHEVTHAIVDKLRYNYRSPTNPDMLALHEGVADIVAIFQHFTFPSVLRDAIEESNADLRRADKLIELAVQFGHGTGKNGALRHALDGEVPDATAYSREFEPHTRGAILVAAVFDAFFKLHQHRVADLLRLASGGTGILPEGRAPGDLVDRVAGEAARTADDILQVCLRAFDYMPVLDADFGDYLRALVTADFELNPNDLDGKRAHLIEAFRARGIFPHGVTSLGEEALLWDTYGSARVDAIPQLPASSQQMISSELVQVDRRSMAKTSDWSEEPKGDSTDSVKTLVHRELRAYALEHASALLLRGQQPGIAGFNPVFRVGEDGKLRTEIVVQYIDTYKKRADLGGLQPAGATTVVYSADGRARYMIAKPWPHDGLDGEAAALAEWRAKRMVDFVSDTDARLSDDYWSDKKRRASRMASRFGFSALHRSPGVVDYE